jgi:hypothetical protein
MCTVHNSRTWSPGPGLARTCNCPAIWALLTEHFVPNVLFDQLPCTPTQWRGGRWPLQKSKQARWLNTLYLMYCLTCYLVHQHNEEEAGGHYRSQNEPVGCCSKHIRESRHWDLKSHNNPNFKIEKNLVLGKMVLKKVIKYLFLWQSGEDIFSFMDKRVPKSDLAQTGPSDCVTWQEKNF